MKTDKRKTGSFLALLIQNYVGFTLTILCILALISTVINKGFERRLDLPSTSVLEENEGLLEAGSYDKFPYKKVLGKRGDFAVLDEDCKVVYKSSDEMETSFTAAELYCIPEMTLWEFTETTTFTNQEGKKQILVKRYGQIPSQDGEMYEETESFMILDENYKVLTNTMDFPAKRLGERELQYMTDSVSKKYGYQKHVFTGEDGRKYTAVFKYKKIDDPSYRQIVSALERLWLLTIPLYIIVVAVFVLKLNRKVKVPLTSLSRTITQYQQGEKPSNEYRGPNEFVEIGDDFVRLANRLNESEERRLKADRDKQKMLADISHDLKTPITVIQGYARAICDGMIPEERREQYLRTIYLKSSALNELINTFYEYSKLEHPDFSPTLKRENICEFAREYLAAKYNEIALAGFDLEVDIPEEPLFCDIDAQQFRRVFENIIANALRHNQEGTILRFKIAAEGNSIKITISDNGKGIPPEIADVIFEPFTVGDESRNSKQGTGLGLAIAKKIVKSHKGYISLSKKPEKGMSTEFIIWMKMGEALSET